MSTADQAMEQLLVRLTTQNAENISRIMAAQQQSIAEILAAQRQHGSMVDNRGVGRPTNFKGEESKFNEWVAKLNAYVKMTTPQGMKWLIWACTQSTPITDQYIQEVAEAARENADPMKEFNAKLFSILVTSTEDDAFKIVNSVKDCSGMEAYRLLKKRYEPKTPGTKRALLKSIINNQQCKRVHEVEANLMNIEELIKRYESMTTGDEKLPDDLKVTVMIDLCHKELREHLEMSTKDLTITEVREEIVNYVERKRDSMNSSVKAMEVDSCDTWWGWGDWCQESAGQEDLNFMGKGFGKNKGKGFGKNDGYIYGAKGKGKGEYFNSTTKADNLQMTSDKGKGKGKGFKGQCWWCLEWGHSQSKCPHKDAYMNNLRKAQEQQWQGKGGRDLVQNVEKEIHDTNDDMLGNLEAKGGWRVLSNVEIRNKYAALEADDEEEAAVVKCQNLHNDVANSKGVKGKGRASKSLEKQCVCQPCNQSLEISDLSTLELSAVNENDELDLTIDSGAAETVTNESDVPEYETLQPDSPERQTSYVLPSGQVIDNKGEKHVKVTTEEGAKCLIRMQVTDVRKSLMSVSKVCDSGHRVVFEKDFGYIEHLQSKQRTSFRRKGGVYVLSVKVEKPSGFARQGR